MGVSAGSPMRIQQEAMKGILPVDVARVALLIVPLTTRDSTELRVVEVEWEIIQGGELAKRNRSLTGSHLAQTDGERLVVAGGTLEVMQQTIQEQTWEVILLKGHIVVALNLCLVSSDCQFRMYHPNL